jgi:hypothetical protein
MDGPLWRRLRAPKISAPAFEKNVPVLGELAVFHAHDIGGDPRSRAPLAREAPVRDNVVAFGEDHVIFVAEGIGKGANELEQAVAGRRNVRAVLNVCRRPELLCSNIVAFC